MRKVLLAGAVLVVAVIIGAGGFVVVALGALSAAASNGCPPATAVGTSAPVPTDTPTDAPLAPRPVASAVSTAAPDSLEIPRGSGTVTLNDKQLAIASAIIAVARQLGVSDQGVKVALMTALQESVLRMYANSSVPESLNYDHDAVGSDHDSLNPFQQRAGWGTVAERMNLDYSIRAFFGGDSGPNGGSPRGLLDILGWETMTPGVAAQTVQVSAYPDAYDKWEAAAETLIAQLGGGISSGCTGAGTVSGQMALPLDQPYQMTNGYGPRDPGVAGASTWHAAIDLQNWPGNCGAPVYAILPGEVTLSSALWLSVKHPDGFVVSYLHMYKSDRLVDVGAQVTAGQQIGRTGNVPPSGGCHLDLRINVADNTNAQVAALTLSQNETRMARATQPQNQNFVDPEQFMQLWSTQVCPTDWCRRL